MVLPNGAFRMSMNVGHNRWRELAWFSPETRSVHRWLEQSRQGARPFFLLVRKELIQRLDRETTYDPRLRPWYQESVQKGDLLISDYLCWLAWMIGLTPLLMPFYHPKRPALAGVVAADILIGQLSELLGQQPVSRRSISLLVNSDDQIIAYPDVE